MVRDDERNSSSPDELAPTSCPVNPAASAAASGDVTRILSAIEQGDGQAAELLLPVVYDELRKLAAVRMAQEKSGQTLQPTALVHEAYLRLVDVQVPQQWDNRRHFFAAAAEAMRRILVENARRKGRQKQGGAAKRQDLCDFDVIGLPVDDEILDLDQALAELANHEPRSAQTAHLRFFAGLTLDETALALGVSLRTAKRDWAYARAWLGRALHAYHDLNG